MHYFRHYASRVATLRGHTPLQGYIRHAIDYAAPPRFTPLSAACRIDAPPAAFATLAADGPPYFRYDYDDMLTPPLPRYADSQLIAADAAALGQLPPIRCR